MQIARLVPRNIRLPSGENCTSLWKRLPEQRHRTLWIKRAIGISIFLALCGLIAVAEKNGAQQQGITLADLGVTPAQKTQIEAMWTLKRQKQIKAVEDLKRLNRLSKDSLATEMKIKETLEKIRAERQEMQQQIEQHEEELIQTLLPRAQLHLTLLGVLDNGLPRRIVKPQYEKTTQETPPKTRATQK